MPIDFARKLTGKHRTVESNQRLGFTLAFIAGATNAGGFLAVKQYTSHMTGMVSSIADSLAFGDVLPAVVATAGLLCFVLGAASTAILVNFARRRQLHSEYALPLLLEAVLLLCFGLLGAQLASIRNLLIPITVMLLCFIMGLQNALISKLSNNEIRTTHVTGIVTDVGIELGKAAYWNISTTYAPVRANGARLKDLIILMLSFFIGGLLGAIGFRYVGYSITIPLAMALVFIASVPTYDDLIALLSNTK
jgi:uncharacterized membrane protein YoaK (UPF0700 family)